MWCIGLVLVWCSQQPLAYTSGATFCQIAQPIYWNKADTRRTKEQVDEHNRIGKKLCGWKAKQ